MISRAWAWRGGSQWTLEEVTTAEPGHGEVLLKIGAVGFCGSEKELEAEPVEDLTPDQLKSLPLIGGRGHEVAGVIEEVGAGVSACKPGDRVVLLHNYREQVMYRLASLRKTRNSPWVWYW